MSEEFKIDIVDPEKSFFTKENVTEVSIPAFEGDIGILKDHINLISFLKPGIVKVSTANEHESFYVEDGIVEFKENVLSILTSSIFNLKKLDKTKIAESIKEAENSLSENNVNDQKRFIINQKIHVLKLISST
tara:strand:+ start:891 stop:1289 length:399 start_codon:yes stop_codon:yes gene_type:complete